MQPLAETGYVQSPRGVTLRRTASDDIVGPIVWEKRAAISAESSTSDVDLATPRSVNVCRLFVAVLGLSVYLGVPASMVYLVVRLVL